MFRGLLQGIQRSLEGFLTAIPKCLVKASLSNSKGLLQALKKPFEGFQKSFKALLNNMARMLEIYRTTPENILEQSQKQLGNDWKQ